MPNKKLPHRTKYRSDLSELHKLSTQCNPTGDSQRGRVSREKKGTVHQFPEVVTVRSSQTLVSQKRPLVPSLPSLGMGPDLEDLRPGGPTAGAPGLPAARAGKGWSQNQHTSTGAHVSTQKEAVLHGRRPGHQRCKHRQSGRGWLWAGMAGCGHATRTAQKTKDKSGPRSGQDSPLPNFFLKKNKPSNNLSELFLDKAPAPTNHEMLKPFPHYSRILLTVRSLWETASLSCLSSPYLYLFVLVSPGLLSFNPRRCIFPKRIFPKLPFKMYSSILSLKKKKN